MKRICLALALLAACGTDFSAPMGDDDPHVADGELVYREHCMMCHGDNGEGSTKGPQVLSPVIPYATYVTRNGRGKEMGYPDAMPAYPELGDAEIAAVLAWLSEPAKPADGHGLYTRFCGNCHGADAFGGRTGKDLTHEVGEEPEELVEKVREGEGGAAYADREEYMPAWGAGEITDPEVALITAYIATLPVNPAEEDDKDEETDEH